MDRESFLSAMPFLLPSTEKSWPPRPRSQQSTMEHLIEPQENFQYKISLETVVGVDDSETGINLQAIQPAFFSKSAQGDGEKGKSDYDDDSFDPAMTDIQVVLEVPATNNGTSERRIQDDSSILQGRNLFGEEQEGSSSSTATPQIHPQPVAEWCRPVFLFFKIGESVFQVDLRQLVHIELVKPKNKEDNAAAELPPSLLLAFPCCVFRIFPLPTANPVADGETRKKVCAGKALETLQHFQKRLLRLPPAVQSAIAWSPTGSSVQTSSNEAGQKEAGLGYQQIHSHSTLTSSSSSRDNKKLKANPKGENKSFQDNHQIRKIRRRRDSVWRGCAGLQSLEIILDVPTEVLRYKNSLLDLAPTLHSEKKLTAGMTAVHTDSAISDGADPKTQLHNSNKNLNNETNMQSEGNGSAKTTLDGPLDSLLAGVAEDMCNAYGTAHETLEVMEMYRHEIEEMRNKRLDALLNSFFPEKRSAGGKKWRPSKSKIGHNRNGDSAAPETLKSADEMMESMQKLINEQRELVEERSSFLMLPTRG